MHFVLGLKNVKSDYEVFFFLCSGMRECYPICTVTEDSSFLILDSAPNFNIKYLGCTSNVIATKANLLRKKILEGQGFDVLYFKKKKKGWTETVLIFRLILFRSSWLYSLPDSASCCFLTYLNFPSCPLHTKWHCAFFKRNLKLISYQNFVIFSEFIGHALGVFFKRSKWAISASYLFWISLLTP